MAEARTQDQVLLGGDVLHIGFHGSGKAPYPEDLALPAVFRALAQHLQVDLQTHGEFWGDYCYFAGVTGEAFRFLEFMGLSAAPTGQALVERYGHDRLDTVLLRAFAAAGLAAEVFRRPQLPAPSALRQRLVESLRDRRTPAVGLGVFGPAEPFLITGYERDGEILLGWSHFQHERQDDPRLSLAPSGEFRLSDWYPVLDGVGLVTGRTSPPAPGPIYAAAITRAVAEVGTRGTPEDALGMAAMEAWAGLLEDDSSRSGWTDAQWEKLQSSHGGTAGDLAERRALADSFLHLAARYLPEVAADLDTAAISCHGMHDTVYEIWEVGAARHPFDPDLAKFKDPGCRRAMAELVRRLVRLDARSLTSLARAHGRLAGAPYPPPVAPDRLLDGVVTLTKSPRALSGEVPWAPENIALPNAMGMLRSFLGEPFGDLNDDEATHAKLDYCVWMGLTGSAFGLLDDGPERAHLPLVFEVLGYDYELWLSHELAQETGLPCRTWGWDDNLRRRIFWNLRDRQLPVLLFHWGHWPDWWLITQAECWGRFQAYGGNSGEGYRPNDPLDHPRNPLRPLSLFDGMQGSRTWSLHLTRRRAAPKPDLGEAYRRAIRWGVDRMAAAHLRLLDGSGTEFDSHEPFVDWARLLETDSLFPADQADILKTRRDWLEGREVELAERRFYGAGFLDLAERRLASEPLRLAAAHCRQVNALMDQFWSHLGGLHNAESHLRLGQAPVRRQLADLVRAMGEEDRRAAARLAEAGV